MSLEIEGRSRIYGLQIAYKRLLSRSPFTTQTVSKPFVGTVNHNPYATLVDDLLLRILCLCDISTVLTVSRVRQQFYSMIVNEIVVRFANTFIVSHSPREFGSRCFLISRLDNSLIVFLTTGSENFHWTTSSRWRSI
jgi:hypothetical protein